jgi:DNA-binding NtrC family response regulator
MASDVTDRMAGEPRPSTVAHADPGLVLVFAPDLATVPPVVFFGQGATVIGREPPPHGVKLALSSVSRTHARIVRKGERCTIHDMGSRNGVLVCGRRVEAAELCAGDDVRIGDALFVFVSTGASIHQGSRPDGAGDTPYPHAPIACGPATRRLFDELTPIAIANIPVLALGETGTGKELIAQAIHAASGRSGLLRALNCAAIPASLVESELFGFKKGAFTGADRDSPGIVRAANGGTFFLDEIGDLPLEIQPKLLRLLESHEVAPVGSTRTERVDVRIVCATHADLDALVATRRFRADLYSRIRGHVIVLPPLRERKEDLVRLVHALLARLGRPDAKMSVAFMVALVRHHWPYNVRELHAVLRRATALASPGELLDTKHLPYEMLSADRSSVANDEASQPTLASSSEVVAAPAENAKPPVPSAAALREALREHGGNVAALARVFQRDRSLIHRWLKQHAIEPEDYRADRSPR